MGFDGPEAAGLGREGVGVGGWGVLGGGGFGDFNNALFGVGAFRSFQFRYPGPCILLKTHEDGLGAHFQACCLGALFWMAT